MRSMSFSVQGEFITQLAREKCFYEGEFPYAIDLLSSCMESDEISKNEVYGLAVAILDGRARLKGTYPNEDYGFEYLPEKDDKWDLGKFIKKGHTESIKWKSEHADLQAKYLFISGSIPDWEKKELNEYYEEEFGEVLFCDVKINESSSIGSALLDSFIKRQKTDSEDDYGWLEPSGTFHPVEWGEHQEWADLYVQKHFTLEYDGEASLQCKTGTGLIGAGEFLVERGWVLLHNPAQGIAYPTKNPVKEYTKKQSDFLFDYYIKRDCEKEANGIYEN
jgi:hypothetical protein